MHTPIHRRISIGLVTAQFGAMACYLPLLFGMRWTWWTIGLLLASAMIGVAALAANPPGNFNIRPEPKRDARLVQIGIYRLIRHPMYSSLLVGSLAVTLGVSTGWSFALWIAFAAILFVKARVEERWMSAIHPDYPAYMRRTKRFVPFVL